MAKVATNDATTISQIAAFRIFNVVAQALQNLALTGAYDPPATGSMVDCMGPRSLLQR